MTALSAHIAREKFVVPPDTLAQTTSDHEAVKALGVTVGRTIETFSSLPKEAETKWQDWIRHADDARVILPYQTFHERMSGNFPSYLPEEQQVIRHLLWQQGGFGKESVLPETVGQLWVTIGAAGAGKSTLLKILADEHIPHRIRVDPDEGVLENHGPYLVARTVLQAAAPPSSATTPEAVTAERNLWRMPPYTTFRWASNVINTDIASTAVAEGRNIEFHWTGAGAFGLKLIKEGYKAAGYPANLVLDVTSLEHRLTREAQRLRPASPEDFTNKAVDFIKLLPESLPQGNRVFIYDGDHIKPMLVFEYLQDREGKRNFISHDRVGTGHIIETMRADIDRAAASDKKPYLEGLSYLQGVIDEAPRSMAPHQSPLLDLKS